MSSIGLDPSALLRVDGRLRVLARELVRDPGEAEDLVQETWVAALEAGDVQSLPGWAASVLRRLVHDQRRGAERRRRREEFAATSEALPAATELLEREEARRRVVEALLALEEPLRATLILRFLEELPPRAVAQRMGVPIETVRSRARRGLAELRARLDRTFGSRETWCAALVHVFRYPSAAEALSTALIVMSIHKKLAVAVVLCALGWLALPRGKENVGHLEERGSETPIALQDASRPGAGELARAQEPTERETLLRDSAAASHDANGSLRIRVSWFDGTPAEGITVHAKPAASELEQREARTDFAGVALLTRLPAGRTSLALDRGVTWSAAIEAGAQTELELTIPRGVDVLGRVETADGQALAGAEVWMAWNDTFLDAALAARSGEDGTFRLRSVRVASLLGACAIGHRPSVSEVVIGQAGEEISVRLALWRGGGEVVGRVVDASNGRALTGVFVGVGPPNSLEVGDAGFRSEYWARSVRTDENGAYRFTGVAPGACSVAARAPGYALARAEIAVSAGGSENADIALLAEAALAGRVLDESGSPVAGVLVAVGQGVDWLRASAKTGADGSFHIGELEANARLEARVYRERGNGQCIASTEFQSLPGQTFVWEARLGQRGRILGRVLDQDGAPLVDWLVDLQGEDSPGVEKTASDGGFRFENLDPGAHRLALRAPDSVFASLELADVRPSDEELVLRVPRERLPSAHIVGMFLDDQGRPIPECMAFVGNGNYSMPVEADERNGAFSCGPLPPGIWRVFVEAPGHSKFFVGQRELSPGETWDCGIVRPALEGRVVTRLIPEGVELGPGLRLRIRDETRIWRENLGGHDPLVRSATLPCGKYELVAFGGDFAEFDVPFEVKSGEETHLDVPVRRGHPAIVVVNCEDTELRDLLVFASLAGEERGVSRTLVRSRSGAFVHTFYLAPGTYRVEARAGERRAEGELVVAATDGEPARLELTLP